MAMLHVDMEEDREVTMTHFLSCLRHKIAELMELQHYVKIEEMVNQAMKIE